MEKKFFGINSIRTKINEKLQRTRMKKDYRSYPSYPVNTSNLICLSYQIERYINVISK